MKYILDFDRTLFDVDRLYEELDRQQVRHLCGTKESFPYLDMPGLLFTDVVPFLKTVPKNDVFILSSFFGTTANWTESYQSQKIAVSGIEKYVKEVVVMSGDKGQYVAELCKQFDAKESVIFVDDQFDQCRSVRAVSQTIACFWIQRGSLEEIPDTQSGISHISALNEITSYIGGATI